MIVNFVSRGSNTKTSRSGTVTFLVISFVQAFAASKSMYQTVDTLADQFH